MTLRQLTLAIGAVLLSAGVVALPVPASVSDGNGRSIGCGNAVADLSGARSANDSGVAGVPVLNQIVPHTDFVALCDSAVSSRRTWSIPPAVIGAVAAAAAVLMRPTSAGGM